MRYQDVLGHLNQPVFVGTPYRGLYIGTLESIHQGDDGKPWRGEVRVTGIVQPPPLHRGEDGFPVEKTQGYAVGDVIDAGALLVSAPLPADCAAYANSTIAEALRRDIAVLKTLLLDPIATADRHHEDGSPTRFEYFQACLDHRVEQLAVASNDGPRAVRFGRIMNGAESKSQIKRLFETGWDDPPSVVEPAVESKAVEMVAVPMGDGQTAEWQATEWQATEWQATEWRGEPVGPDNVQAEPTHIASPSTDPMPSPVVTLPLPAPALPPLPSRATKIQQAKPKPAPAPKPKPVQSSLF